MIIQNFKFEAYVEVLNPFSVVDSLRTFKDPSLCVLGYHWLPLATIDLLGDNREFEG